ncbi:MAG: cob(I)yrinic acid a,c-diamide adenosyltransferase [Mycoplasmatales bacterium]
MKIYTKTGDAGMTALLGDKRLKSDLRVTCYGLCDELQAYIGEIYNLKIPKQIKDDLFKVLSNLFLINYLTVSLEKPVEFEKERIEYLEQRIDQIQEKNEPLKWFIYPIGNDIFVKINIVRTKVRTCERTYVELSSKEGIDPNVLAYFNRLSDYMFVIARYCNTTIERKVDFEKL